MEIKDNHFFYVLQCGDGSFYGGYTIDLVRRLGQHNKGIASKYTRTRLPVLFLHAERFSTKRAAMQTEYAFKRLSRIKKEQFIHERRDRCVKDTTKFFG
ncbi:GIY-YIG nuclease family protein [Jeotgalibacillus soli]|uniref:GIY-YIG domain-containing protein n=1 Tax=Jeotgalibacillus soli TaxID=889306 RepID=A0A0C2W7F5_9BACL|nr:GIY-YIG nuclease family protein [Jeotgalibacillus soli]KIL52496.1 hypothetical protein KP78_00310 [Jeotgalibacillus soli]